MINFYSETDFKLPDQDFYRDWINACMDKEGGKLNEINYIFCDDEYLLKINQEHLEHDTYTDIITFDYSDANQLAGDIFISVDRVADNAHQYDNSFDLELSRVMIHGLLHMLGYTDKTESEKGKMREKEDECLSLQISNENE